MTVEVTDLELNEQEILILMLESAIEASRQREQWRFKKVIKAVQAWEEAKNQLDNLNRRVADARKYYLRDVA